MIDDCTAIVLAGGESRRMGRDKAAIEFAGQPLLRRVVAGLATIFPEVRVSVRAPRPELDLPQICDAVPGAGPLAGLCAALAHGGRPWVFLVATDMPFLRVPLIEALAARREGVDAVLAVVDGVAQPLAAFYSAACRAAAEDCLAGPGPHSLRAVLERVRVCCVDATELLAADPRLESFVDLDTPADLERALSAESTSR